MASVNHKLDESKQTIVTCGLPYANGPCHVGHLRTYIPADIYVRMMRKLGRKVHFVCGSDAHGTPIIVNAEELGTTPGELVDKYHAHFKQVFEKLEIHFDNYGRTDSETNHNRTREIVRALMDNGYIPPRTVHLAYCPKCKRGLPDRYVEGICPYCKSRARGDECAQGCGRHLEPGEVEQPTCGICGSEAEFRDQEHYFFSLSEFRDFLIDYLKTLGGTSNARNYAQGWVEQELRDWCITRNLEWGVRFPGNEDLVVYVWVDAPIGYISFTEDLAASRGEPLEKYWKDQNMNIVHFIGGDIIYHHCVFWPALLKGAGYSLPSAVVASGMLKIDDRKFSKTRGYVVWAEEDYLEHGFHPDLLRYYLASYTSHTKELNFSWKVFQEKLNNELVAILGNFAYRVLLFTYKNCKSVPKGEISPDTLERIKAAEKLVSDAMEEYKFKKLVDGVMGLANHGNAYFQSNEPWHLIKDKPEKCGEVLRNCLQMLKALAVMLEPVMPDKMNSLWKQLGMGTDIRSVRMEEVYEPIPVGQEIGKPEILFSKMEDDKLAEMEGILRERVARAQDREAQPKSASVEKEDGAMTIPFKEFQKLDMRVGEILSAEPIEGSDKLLVMKVDLGEDEPRQIVAGIAKLHRPESLVGKQIVVAANLEPARLFGVESNGMLLAAGDGAVILSPEKKVAPGTRIN